MTTTTTTLTRHETAIRFLSALAGAAGPSEFVELRYRLDDGQRMGQLFDRPTQLRGLATRALWLGRRTDVYVGCAPRTRRHGGRDAIERAFVLWADCDGEHAVDALERFEPAPPIVIASGTGRNCHAYWPLAEPLAADEIERGNRRLAHALGADPASADAARILRVPATFRTSTEPPSPSTRSGSTSSSASPRPTSSAALPDPPRAAPSRRAGAPRLARRRSAAGRSRPTSTCRGCSRVEVPRHRKVACPFHPDRHPEPARLRHPGARLVLLRRCRRGGTIYDLAAPLYGYDPRGKDFLRLRAELRKLFELGAVVMPEPAWLARVRLPPTPTFRPAMTIREWRASRAVRPRAAAAVRTASACSVG